MREAETASVTGFESLGPAGESRDVALDVVQFPAKMADAAVDIVDRDSGCLTADGLGVEVEPALDLGLERNLASFERLLLFALPFDGRAMLLTFTVEMAEDYVGACLGTELPRRDSNGVHRNRKRFNGR